MRKKITALLVVPVVLLISCSADKKNPFALEDISGSSLGKVNYIEITGTLQEQSVKLAADLPTSDDMLLGKYRQVESAIALKFGTITDDLAGATINKAYLFLTPKTLIKDKIAQPMTVNMYPVTITWDEESAQPLDILNNFDPSPVATALFQQDSIASQDSISLATDFVQKWVNQTIDNNGVILLATSSDHIIVYYSDETSLLPQLKVIYEKDGQADSLFIDASEGLSILKSDFQIPTDRLAVGSGDAYASFFKLNYAEIPKNATINHALLTLNVDTLQSIHPSGYFFDMTQIPAGSSDWSTSPNLADSTLADTTRYRGGKTLQVDITGILQNWVDRDGTDFGFRLAPYNSSNGLFRAVIYNSNADAGLRPKLSVFFSIPPTFTR